MPGPSNASNRFGSSSYIVGTPANGLGNGVNFTSIQAAVNQAVADGFGPANPVDVVIRAGVYTEDVTITDGGISLVGVSDAPPNLLGQQTFIDGTISLVITGINQFALSNLFVRGVLGPALSVTGGGNTCKMSADNCTFSSSAAATPGVSFTNASGTFGLATFTNCSLTSSLAEAHFSSARTISVFFSCNLRGSTNMVTLDGTARVQLLYSVGSANAGFGVQFLNAANQVAGCRFSTIAATDSIVDMTPGGSSTIEQCTFDSSAASGFFITGTGNLVYTDLVNTGLAIDLDPALGVITVGDWKPYAQPGAGPAPSLGTVRGTSCFDNTQFTVTDGFVELVGGVAAGTFPVDNGGPGVPLAGAMSFLGSTSVDFPNPSGIETHVGATTNQIYIEDRRWLSSFVVDPSATVGLRGTFTTIQAAINAVVSTGTIYVRPGTYTESITIPAGLAVQIIGSQSSAENSIVTIVGDITHAGAGTSLALENMAIGFSAATTYTQSEGSTTAKNCVFFSTASSACVISAVTASFAATDCQFQTAGISDLVQVTDSITTSFDQCIFNSPTANIATIGTADLKLNYCKFNHVIVATDSSVITVQYSRTDNPVNPAYTTTALATINAYHNVANTTDASGFFASGVGTFNWADIVLLSDQGVDPALTNRRQNWQPYADSSAAALASVRGTSSYDSAQFTVTDGWVQLLGSAVASSYATDSGTAIPAAGVLNILGGPGVTTSATGNTVTINSVIWSNVAAPVTVVSDSGTFDVVGVTITLPAAPVQGEECRVISVASPTVIQAAGVQTIQLGNVVSSAGGTCTGTAVGDSVVLVYFAAFDRWYSAATNGNWTLA